MRILVVIPCLYGVEHTREAIESVINKPDVDVLLIDNGAEGSVQKLLSHYFKTNLNCHKIANPTNIYVNPAWQQGIELFLKLEEYTHLIIINSDLIMQKEWAEVCINRWRVNPDEILLPVMVNDKHMSAKVSTDICEAQLVHAGTPGVFITLSRKQVEIINPLPKECIVWFGDQFIYSVLRGLGYKTVIPANLISYHYWSQNVQKVSGISEIIEEDKRNWLKYGERQMIERIELHRIK